MQSVEPTTEFLPKHMKEALQSFMHRLLGLSIMMLGAVVFVMLASYNPLDPSFNIITNKPVDNWFGIVGSHISDILLNTLGIAAFLVSALCVVWGYKCIKKQSFMRWYWRLMLLLPLLFISAASFSFVSSAANWASHYGMGGYIGFEIKSYIELAHLYLIGLLGTPTYFDAIFATTYYTLITAWVVANIYMVNWLLYTSNKQYYRILASAVQFMLYMWQKLPHKNNNLSDNGKDDAGGGANVSMRTFGSNALQGMSREQELLDNTRKTFSHHALVRLKSYIAEIIDNASKAEHENANPYAHNPLLQNHKRGMGPDIQYTDTQYTTDTQYSEEPLVASSINNDTVSNSDNDASTANPLTQAEEPLATPMHNQQASVIQEAETANPAINFAERAQVEMALPESAQKSKKYQFPKTDILSKAPASIQENANQDFLQENARLLEETLKDFGVKGTINHIHPGPVVTLYELEPAPGTKTSRIIGLSDDIARSMSALSVRIATIPGRSVIGIEMPNKKRESVFLRELLESKNFQGGQYKLPVILGKDIGGGAQIADLATMPHLLIAGTTGSGKSVGLNAMIVSLLYRYQPSDCKFIMIDPKMLELSCYDKIPHLLSPVVTDPKKAIVALKWAVSEMEERYLAMSRMGVRNIEGYNMRIQEAIEANETISRKIQVGFDKETAAPIYEEEFFEPKKYPFIVIVVDEMADLMLVAGKEIEASIQRLAQMARAAGIHLIMATQRPSVDVITGTIKANFPTRISFMVTSKIDSRTILGEQGAEQLLGKGDMLYMAPGGRISRIHGPFVEDQEVELICDHLRMQGLPEYVEAVTEDSEHDEMAQFELEQSSGDDLYDKAVQLVASEGKASTSFIQRHLQIGYNRAARIIEQMEKENIVSPANHVGKREVLIGHHAA